MAKRSKISMDISKDDTKHSFWYMQNHICLKGMNSHCWAMDDLHNVNSVFQYIYGKKKIQNIKEVRDY